jgi:hypothetical protein
MESGVRRIDFELLPLGQIIEGPRSDSQRVFIADSDHPKCQKLMERLRNQEAVPPHVQSVYARLN